MAACDVIGDQPVPVFCERRPAGKNEASAGLQRAADIAEGRRRIGEEHDLHARGGDIEGGGLEREHLRVPGQQSDVAQSALAHLLARGAEHRLGDVDRDNAAMLADRFGERQGQRSGSTADFEHAFAAGNA
jgi:hypothetical protein